jgi:hypothetical protein
MTLQDWLNNGWLTAHKTSPQEIKNLLALADRDIAECRISGLSSDWRLNIAYNAALQASVAALAAAGFRASRESHHFRVIQSLVYTIGATPGMVQLFDRFRKKRNIGGYERAGLISDQEAAEMLELAKKIRNDVEEWLRTTHPELHPD